MMRSHPHRLDSQIYQGKNIVSITCCIQNRIHTFTNTHIFQTCESILKETLKKYSMEAHVYLFMPDHFHVLLEGTNDESDPLKAISLFKQKTGYLWAKEQQVHKWQKSFFDHVLRHEENVMTHLRYILDNPLRAKICSDWKQYPYKGSTLYDFSAIDL